MSNNSPPQCAAKPPSAIRYPSSGSIRFNSVIRRPMWTGVSSDSRFSTVSSRQRAMRSGTLATHQIVGMGEAFRIAAEEMAAENERILALRNKLYDGLKDMEEVYLNGDYDRRVPGNLNVSFNFVEGESLIMALNDMAVSSGSACTSSSRLLPLSLP